MRGAFSPVKPPIYGKAKDDGQFGGVWLWPRNNAITGRKLMAELSNYPDIDVITKRKARMSENSRRHYANHRDEILERQRGYQAGRKVEKAEYDREYKSRNREKIKLQNAEYLASHKEEALERNRKWTQKHRDRMSDRNRKWYAEHKAEESKRSANWRTEHPEAGRFSSHLRRARKRNATGTDYTTLGALNARWEYYGHKCWVCGDNASETDHVKPLSKGGSEYPCNLRPICAPCNRFKKNKWPYDVFAARISLTKAA